ncbi:MAG: protein kinase, partial [Acidobacteria bacterium]|nr:protein kinase [Acidobacteriota bacterium]
DQSVWELAAQRQQRTNIGPYRVVKMLGEGGMGSVFLAARDDEQFEQRVAIKLVRGGHAMLRRFRQERQILAALEHPNIARLFDGGQTSDGLPYLVMEYVEGTPIDAYCAGRPIAARLRLFLQLCDAVQYAHRNLVIHRDIKPANVLVTRDGVPKLLDFGIAKLTSDEELRHDATVTRLMTPDYASPEQLLGKPVTTATDVYSLGILLFEILTGTRPFHGKNRTIEVEAPLPSSVAHVRGLRGDLDGILLTALEPDPAQRYGSVEKFADDIRKHLEGHPVSARSGSVVYRWTKFLKRNKYIVTASAAGLVMATMSFTAIVKEKRMAERRFEQVRTLARSMVYEIHDAIAPIPGSTAARELIVRRALGYLDAIAGEASSNTPLQMELAGAYERVGDVQGLPYNANLGDTAGALASYRKAIAIAAQVRDSEPENVEALRLLADLHDRAGLVQQRALRWYGALQDHEQARAIRESLPQDVAGDLLLARTYVGIGDSVYQGNIRAPLQDYERALKILERIPPNGPHRARFLVELGRTHQRLGGYFTGPHARNPEAALAHHRAAEKALEDRMKMDPDDAVARRNYADQLVMTATLQNTIGDQVGVLDGTAKALPILRALANADPDNVEAQRDVAFVLEQRAHAQAGADADQSYDEALAIRQRLVARDKSNREDQRGIYGTYAGLAQKAADRGDGARAIRYAAAAKTAAAVLGMKYVGPTLQSAQH